MVLAELPAARVCLVLQHAVDPGQQHLSALPGLDRIELPEVLGFRLLADLQADVVQLLHGPVDQQFVVRGEEVPDSTKCCRREAAKDAAQGVSNERPERADFRVKVEVSPLVKLLGMIRECCSGILLRQQRSGAAPLSQQQGKERCQARRQRGQRRPGPFLGQRRRRRSLPGFGSLSACPQQRRPRRRQQSASRTPAAAHRRAAQQGSQSAHFGASQGSPSVAPTSALIT
mmetsp:Transcript_69283/g.191701  ORF Transcript_69283/g.191701 Transcript_69283/m.191701 type:complete len:230 (-) Transcript_69283:15-704(-)